jgi:hypothetical protein
MSALDKIKKAIAPSENDELATASAERETGHSRLSQLADLGARLERELAEAKRPLGELSLDESAEGRKAYDAVLSKVEKLEREQHRNADAQVAIRARLQAINARIVEITRANDIQALTRQGSKREKKANELQDRAVAFVHAYQAYYNATEEIITARPQVADSIGLDTKAVANAVAIELYRIWPVGPGHRNAASAVPGAHSGLGLDDPRRLPTLVDIVRQENAAALSKFKSSVTPVVEAARPEPPYAVVEPEPTPPPPLPGKTVNAADVPITTVVIDAGNKGRAR